MRGPVVVHRRCCLMSQKLEAETTETHGQAQQGVARPRDLLRQRTGMIRTAPVGWQGFEERATGPQQGCRSPIQAILRIIDRRRSALGVLNRLPLRGLIQWSPAFTLMPRIPSLFELGLVIDQARG